MAQATSGFSMGPVPNYAAAGAQSGAMLGQGIQQFGMGVARIMEKKRQAKAENEQLDQAIPIMRQFLPEKFKNSSDQEVRQAIKGAGGPEKLMEYQHMGEQIGKERSQSLYYQKQGEEKDLAISRLSYELEELKSNRGNRDTMGQQKVTAGRYANEASRLANVETEQGLDHKERDQIMEEEGAAREAAQQEETNRQFYAKLNADIANNNANRDQKGAEYEKTYQQANSKLLLEAEESDTRLGDFLRNGLNKDNTISKSWLGFGSYPKFSAEDTHMSAKLGRFMVIKTQEQLDGIPEGSLFKDQYGVIKMKPYPENPNAEE